jgi:hypothetical protein
MRVTVTPGTGTCNHLTIKDAGTGTVLLVGTLAELKAASTADNPSPLLAQMRQVAAKLGAGATKAQVKTAIEAEDFV